MATFFETLIKNQNLQALMGKDCPYSQDIFDPDFQNKEAYKDQAAGSMAVGTNTTQGENINAHSKGRLSRINPDRLSN